MIDNFLSQEICDEVTKRVLSLKEYWYTNSWSEFSKETGTWMLGASSPDIAFKNKCNVYNVEGYLNGEDGMKKTMECVNKEKEIMNPIMWENFSFLYKHMEQELSKHLGKKCVIDGRFTLPGFWIYTDKIGEYIGQPWHYDDQKQLYAHQFFDVEPTTNYSITIAIQIPTKATFECYDVPVDKYRKPGEPYFNPCPSHIGLRSKCSNPECVFEKQEYGSLISLPYKRGSLALQTGRLMHRAGVGYHSSRDEMRLTIQCHAITFNDVVYVYW